MKKLLLIALALTSVSAFASELDCYKREGRFGTSKELAAVIKITDQGAIVTKASGEEEFKLIGSNSTRTGV